jgi:protein-S-isoprenylcysteine O-methyltransferase Ste14
MNDKVHIAAIVLAWGLYGLIHSWLAGTRTKHRLIRRWPALRTGYRLFYNFQSVVLTLPPLALTWFYPGQALWHWPAWLSWSAFMITVLGFLWSTRWYDSLDFLGLRQLRGHGSADEYRETFVLSPLHRYVRHPWYSLGLLYLWTRDLNAGWLAATLVITIYLAIGSRLEERKLAEAFGEPYRRYRERVPGLIPLPGRSISREEANALLRDASRAPAELDAAE